MLGGRRWRSVEARVMRPSAACQRASMVFRDAVSSQTLAPSASRSASAPLTQRGEEVGERGVAPGVAPEVRRGCRRGTPSRPMVATSCLSTEAPFS